MSPPSLVAKEMMKDRDPDRVGKLSFDDFLSLLASIKTPLDYEGPDPKVLEFLRILEEYRLKCEEEGNYMEAARAEKQLQTLRKQEEKRQNKSLKARQISERQDVQIAHNMQYSEFNAAWDKYMEEYDQMAQMYIQQMTEKHSIKLREFQQSLQQELMKKPPKFSKELLEWRRREQTLAKQRKYAEAMKIKNIADKLEEEERSKIDDSNKAMIERKETEFRKQHQTELAALLKRIDGRRKEHIKQRAIDSKRLLQRNRNVQAVLEQKQTIQAKKIVEEIKDALAPPRRHTTTSVGIDTGLSVLKKKKQREVEDESKTSPVFLTEGKHDS
jgi:hypothetical protein